MDVAPAQTHSAPAGAALQEGSSLVFLCEQNAGRFCLDLTSKLFTGPGPGFQKRDVKTSPCWGTARGQVCQALLESCPERGAALLQMGLRAAPGHEWCWGSGGFGFPLYCVTSRNSTQTGVDTSVPLRLQEEPNVEGNSVCKVSFSATARG